MIVFVIVAAAAAIFAFCRPRGAFRFAGLTLLAAVALPFVIGCGLAPFVCEGAGMGVAFILYALSAMIATLAVFGALGAGRRQAWNALR